MILHDNYALHRKWWLRDWEPVLGDTDWVFEDYFLADIFQVIEDYTNKNNGVWIPYDQSGDITWDVRSTISRYDAAIEKEKERRKDSMKPGESLYAVPLFDDEDNKPTLESWAKDQEEGNTGRPSKAIGARPPTAEELAAMGLL